MTAAEEIEARADCIADATTIARTMIASTK